MNKIFVAARAANPSAIALTFMLLVWATTESVGQETLRQLVPATEMWSDPALPIKDNLMLWLDASRIDSAFEARGVTAPAESEPVSVWPDASGNRRDLTQTETDRQPVFHQTGDFRSVLFSGDDFLSSSIAETTCDELTVFIVSATYSTPAPYSAWISFSAKDRNDYQSGLNIDQGSGSASTQRSINVEGVGAGGESNLLKGPIEFGSVTHMCVTSSGGPDGIGVWVNGDFQGSRPRQTDSSIHTEEVVLGGRRYNNSGGSPEPQAFFDGDIAEILVYDRLLTEDQRRRVEEYLKHKYRTTKKLPVPIRTDRGEPLVRVENPPLAQVFVPGFAVREVPIELPNINNILYRPDGTLIALGYNGNIWRLTDTNGDGLPDQYSLFWENHGEILSPIGMDLTTPGFPDGDGVYVACKGKCTLILDTDRDGRADEERILANDWQPLQHNVDCLGVAVSPKDGSVYFGRGTTDFTNAYLINDKGESQFDLSSERGTILRISPDGKQREIVCTGIRFPVGLRFNRAGDLFCTDQEGATWLANGNPFDELLHIQTGRHYGFPPRHPKHLPDVIDEPSTFDYGPQHQSTCGFCFNEPITPDGNTFGPDHWVGDAFVTGYSRGKLYRTELSKTEAGYVARNHLFACLNMLPVDCCLTPDGGLLVAVHSGGPDWGSGPAGIGKLLKVEYREPESPQPTLVWPASSHELRVEFDRPIPAERLRGTMEQVEITAGPFVRAGDRFESLWPGYSVVHAQQRSPRRRIRIHSVQQTADLRTLVIATDQLSVAEHYSLTLPRSICEAQETQGSKDESQQIDAIDLGFNLSGCEAAFSQHGEVVWSGWLPTLDLKAAREWTTGSAFHDQLWRVAQEPGEWRLSAQMRLDAMLRPKVQPGSQIEYELPPEVVHLDVPGGTELQVHREGGTISEASGIAVESGDLADVNVRFESDSLEQALKFSIAYRTNEDERLRPMPPSRVLLPWAKTENHEVQSKDLAEIPELKGGSWARGWSVFHNSEKGCAKCHSIHGSGNSIGPDLSNLIHRDYASVLRDITNPSFAINPDYLTSIYLLDDGRVIQGFSQTVKGQLHVSDSAGKTTVIDPDEIELVKPSSKSVMPEGLLKTLSDQEQRDLLTFLLTRGPSMPTVGVAVDPPSPRSFAEVQSFLSESPLKPNSWKPLRVVLVGGAKDHGPGEHDYPAWLKSWSELFSIAENVTVVQAMEWPDDDELEKADAMVFYQRGDWNQERSDKIDSFLSRGGGLTYIHWAVDGREHAPEFAGRIGKAWGPGSRFRHGPLKVDFDAQDHPIARGFRVLKMVDESYWNLTGELTEVSVLGHSIEENQPRPMFWAKQHSGGRVFVSIPGHYSWTFDDPLFRILLLRGISWSAGEPVDRFNPLVLPGANVTN